MKKEKKKCSKLDIQTNLRKVEKYYFVPQLSNVFYPFQPYPQQINIIRSIQNAIKNKQNALIQSPTGTGKTLCLLIGCLSSLIDTDSKKKIFYLTRTHSQISQVINQFKKTVYECNINVIGSREQFCLNYNISQLKGKHLQKACDELCIQKLCTFKQHNFTKIPKPMEISEFRDFCRKQLVCPYFYSKQLTQKCEITILPFNYLLDWNLYEKNSIDLKDSVIVFDEAHNIDSLCQQGSDMKLNSDILMQAIAELKALIKIQSKKFLHRQFKQPHQQCRQVEELKEQFESLLSQIKNSQQISFISRQDFLQKMQNFTTTINYQGLDLGNFNCFCFKGKRVVKMFHKKQLNCDNLGLVLDILQKIFNISSKNDQFQKFTVTLSKNQLLFRCLDPSLCFKRLTDSKPRSIILSSGTLGNLKLWQKNLQAQFHQKLTNQSFITSKHLYAQVKAKSQNGIQFNFSFQGKQSEKQFQQICKQLKRLEEIVNGGVIVAFSNYDLLEKTLKFSSILSKKVYYQTKGGNIDDIFKKYSENIQDSTTFLFIIMKGRFSEGINFNDKLCRCLVVIGIPFLPMKNSGISEKMKYLQNNFSKFQAELWYSEQSFRALNQTIGRAIRNPSDYAAILLFDQRYLKQQNIKQLSKWFTNCLRSSTSFYSGISQFFKMKQQSKNNVQQKITDNETKNKFQPSICERLLQFSTPAKSQRRRLKLMIKSEEKQEERQQKKEQNKIQTILKDIGVNESQQQSYNCINQDQINYFINRDTKDTQEKIVNLNKSMFMSIDKSSQYKSAIQESECNLITIKTRMKNLQRYKYELDF